MEKDQSRNAKMTCKDLVKEIREEWAKHYWCEDSLRPDGRPSRMKSISSKELADRIEAIGNAGVLSGKVREVFEDLLYMARKYAMKSASVEIVLFDRETKETVKTINFLETIEKAEALLAEKKDCLR